MSKEENVIKYYVTCNRLKNVIRTGWKDWHVKKDRIESVAEHIFGVQMLAIAMKSEYGYEIDLMKVIFMQAVQRLPVSSMEKVTHTILHVEWKHLICERFLHRYCQKPV